MLTPIIIGGILAVLTFVGLTLHDRLQPDRYDETYEQALRKRRSPNTW
jgi:hypothetical protein